MSRRRRHVTRWVAGGVLLVLVVVGIVLATRTPQEATAVQSQLLGRQAPDYWNGSVGPAASLVSAGVAAILTSTSFSGFSV